MESLVVVFLQQPGYHACQGVQSVDGKKYCSTASGLAPHNSINVMLGLHLGQMDIFNQCTSLSLFNSNLHTESLRYLPQSSQQTTRITQFHHIPPFPIQNFTSHLNQPPKVHNKAFPFSFSYLQDMDNVVPILRGGGYFSPASVFRGLALNSARSELRGQY